MTATPSTMLRSNTCWKGSPARAGAPGWLHPWLTDPSSLTARIVARCARFRVVVLREALATPCADEASLIGLPLRSKAWVREVLLVADDAPVVFAQSVMVPQDLSGAWHIARAIGSRPLGAALFADPGIRRGRLQSARISGSHPLHDRAEAAVGHEFPALWARRSLFWRQNHPLLVTEVFLPNIHELV